MAKTARIELRIDPALKARVEEMADGLGQTTTVFVERALEAALAAPKGVVPSRPPIAPAFNRARTLKR